MDKEKFYAPMGGRSLTASSKRSAQLRNWDSSATNKESDAIKPSRLRANVQFGDTVVFLAAAMSGDVEDVERLVAEGADVNAINSDGLTGLHQCCIDDDFQMVQTLVQQGAIMDLQDNEGWSPLHAATSCGHEHIVRYLLKKGAHPALVNNEGDTPLDLAEDQEEIESLLSTHIETHNIDIDGAKNQEEAFMLEDANKLQNDSSLSPPTSPGGASLLHVAAAKGYLSVMGVQKRWIRLRSESSVSYTSLPLDEATAELYTDHLTQLMSDRCPYYSSGKGVSGVSWHPRWDGRGLLVSPEGDVREIQAYDKIPLSWSANVELLYGSSSELHCTEVKSKVKGQSIEDISVKMKERVTRDYNFDAEHNLSVVEEPLLKGVWNWVLMQKELMQRGHLERSAKSLLGVCSVLGADKPVDYEMVTPTTTSKAIGWREREGAVHGETPQFTIYLSKERRLALRLCGWSFEVSTLEDFLKRQELDNSFERAAAVAVFHGHIRRGITSLKDGAVVAKQQNDNARASVLNLIALALSGYTPQESRLWRETCYGVKSQITHPYLRATFNFLCSSGRDAFADVLNETEMSLQDRVAFACTYLDDRQLIDHISSLTRQVVSRGDVGGLFLTGLPGDGISLLTHYVNKTGDVQLACLLAGQVMTAVSRIPQVQGWFQGYRDLLDQWQMWHRRALFDGQRKQLDPTLKPSRQAFVMCSFCSKSIASESLRLDRRSAYHGSQSGRKVHEDLPKQATATSCPNCRKPLPRCSLCLLNMVATGNKPTPQSKSPVNPSDQFGQWFTWCQSCRHGGHANHIAEWFSNHQECPVTGCTCQCYSLDP